MLSSTLPIVFSSAMGRYALGLVLFGFFGLRMTKVVVALKGCGKWPVVMLCCARARMCG